MLSSPLQSRRYIIRGLRLAPRHNTRHTEHGQHRRRQERSGLTREGEAAHDETSTHYTDENGKHRLRVSLTGGIGVQVGGRVVMRSVPKVGVDFRRSRSYFEHTTGAW